VAKRIPVDVNRRLEELSTLIFWIKGSSAVKMEATGSSEMEEGIY
jgi:hypothetical protein